MRARQPWRNDDLQRMRQNVRQAERKWRHTRLVVHRQIRLPLCQIESSSRNTKEMYHITNDLMGRTRQNVLPKCDGGPAELAESFETFFIDKIVDIICSRLTTLRNFNQPFMFDHISSSSSRMRFIHFSEYQYINNVQYVILHTRIGIISHVSVKAITSKLGKS